MSKIIAASDRDWQKLIGIQFATGGMNPKTGLNCYGLVRELYKKLEIELPAREETVLTEDMIAREGKNWIRIDAPEPYCVALIKSDIPAQAGIQTFHFGIITPELELLHVLPKSGVVVSRLSKYRPRIVGYFRYKKDGGECLPEGEGDWGKAIGSILILIASIYVPGLLGLTYGTTAYAIASAVIMIGGSMVVNAMFPMKTEMPQLSGWGSSSDLQDSRTYTWDGVVNDHRQGLVKPMLFGEMIVGGQIISEKTWYDFYGNDEFLDMLFCPCVGPITRFTNSKINDTSTAYYSGVAINYRPGDDEQGIISQFDVIHAQYMSGVLMPHDSSETAPSNVLAFSSKSKITGCRIVAKAPGGIYEMVDNNVVARTVTCFMQYKKHAESTWLTFPIGDATLGSEIPMIVRADGTFANISGNIYSLTDGGVRPAGFSNRMSAGADFEIKNDGVIYYCTQNGTLSTTVIRFNAFTDAARTVQFTGAFTNGPYYLFNGDLIPTSLITSGIGIEFETEIDVSAIYFDLTVYPTILNSGDPGYSLVTWGKFKVSIRKVGDTDWTLLKEYQTGCCTTECQQAATWHVNIQGLTFDKHQVKITWHNFCCTNPNGDFNVNFMALNNLKLGGAARESFFTLTGLGSESVTRTLEYEGLEEDYYDFKIWRTTFDQTSVYWQDDVYLASYSEIINAPCAYPNHALMGVQAIATNRLSGSRPKVTATGIGSPLSVPAAAAQYNTEIVSDEGIIETGNVNQIIVDGMRKIVIDVALPAPAGDGSDKYFWLVFMDTAGYAQEDRLLTKMFKRVHTWELINGGTQTRLYIQSTESFTSGNVMLFHEDDAPIKNTAWAVAKALIQGSQGRIPAAKIDWESFASWNIRNEGLVWNAEKGEYEKRNQCDALIDFQGDLWGTALRLAATAQGMIIAAGGKYKVMIDKADTPRQVFSEGNTKNVQVHPIPRIERANILVTDFLDQYDLHKQKTISEDDVLGNEQPIVKTLPSQVGVTRESQVRRNLKQMLKHNRFVDDMIVFEADTDAIECEVGEVFVFQSQAHDFACGGRIVGVKGQNVVLDREINPETGQTYKLYIWLKDGTVISWQGTLSGVDLTEVPQPEGFPQIGIDPYELPYVLSKVVDEKTKYRALNIKLNTRTIQSTITGLEYRDEVYTDD